MEKHVRTERTEKRVQPRAIYERKKAHAACLVCRKRKTKCDNVMPVCGFCERTGGECQYANNADTSRYDPATLAILRRLDQLEQVVLSGPPGKPPSKRQTSSESAAVVPGGSRDEWTCDDRHESLLHQSDKLDVSEDDKPPSSETMTRAYSSVSIEAMFDWETFSHYLFAEDARNTVPMNHLGYQVLPQIQDLTLFRESNLDAERATALLESFLTNILPSSPVLDPERLRQDMEHFVIHGFDLSDRTCLCLLVLALGAISSSLPRGSPSDRISTDRQSISYKVAERYFSASQLLFGTVLHSNSLLSLQCSYFAAVYLSFTMRMCASWKAFSQAGTQCLAYFQSRGLVHNNSQTKTHTAIGSPIPDHLGVLEESLYWVILKSEAEICIELGLPSSAMHNWKYPHIFPHPPSELLEASTDSNRERLMNGWLYYLGEIALKRLQNRVLKFYFTNDSNIFESAQTGAMSIDTILQEKLPEFDVQLQQWLQTLPDALRFSVESSTYLENHLQWVLRAHRLDVIELLRLPAIFVLLNRPSSTSASEHWNSLSQSVTSMVCEYLENAVRRIEIHIEEFYYRHQGVWLTIRACTRSAIALLGAELFRLEAKHEIYEHSESVYYSDGRDCQSAVYDMPQGWRAAVDCTLNMLRAWEGESADVAHLRNITERLSRHCTC